MALLVEMFQSLNHLQTLALNLSFRYRSQNPLIILMNIIPLKNLTSLILNMSGNHSYDDRNRPLNEFNSSYLIKSLSPEKQENYFISKFSQCSLLSHLSLSVHDFNFSNEAFKQLSIGLKKLEQLSSLNLNLPVESAEGPRLIMSSLQDIPNLKSIDVQFNGTGLLHDQQIRDVRFNLARRKTLKKLNLRYNKVKI